MLSLRQPCLAIVNQRRVAHRAHAVLTYDVILRHVICVVKKIISTKMQATAPMARENAISDKYSHCGGGEGSVCSERGYTTRRRKEPGACALETIATAAGATASYPV